MRVEASCPGGAGRSSRAAHDRRSDASRTLDSVVITMSLPAATIAVARSVPRYVAAPKTPDREEDLMRSSRRARRLTALRAVPCLVAMAAFVLGPLGAAP